LSRSEPASAGRPARRTPCGAQLLAVELADVGAADAHAAARHVVEPLEQREDGRLAGAGRSDQRRPPAGGAVK
jgi:hypothetical protein